MHASPALWIYVKKRVIIGKQNTKFIYTDQTNVLLSKDHRPQRHVACYFRHIRIGQFVIRAVKLIWCRVQSFFLIPLLKQVLCKVYTAMYRDCTAETCTSLIYIFVYGNAIRKGRWYVTAKNWDIDNWWDVIMILS